MYVNSGQAGSIIEAIPVEGEDFGLWITHATLQLESGNVSRTNLWMNIEVSGAPIVNNHVVLGYVQFQNPDVDG